MPSIEEIYLAGYLDKEAGSYTRSLLRSRGVRSSRRGLAGYGKRTTAIGRFNQSKKKMRAARKIMNMFLKSEPGMRGEVTGTNRPRIIERNPFTGRDTQRSRMPHKNINFAYINDVPMYIGLKEKKKK